MLVGNSVDVRPLTGRTSITRSYGAYWHPICGDGKYAGDDAHPGGLITPADLHAWQLKLTDGKVITAPPSPHLRLADLGMDLPAAGWRFKDY